MIKKIKDFFNDKKFLKSNTWLSQYELDSYQRLGFVIKDNKLVKHDKHWNFDIYIKHGNTVLNNKILPSLYVENIFIYRIISVDALKYGELDDKIETYLDINTIKSFRGKFNDWFRNEPIGDDETSEEYFESCPISELFDIYMDYKLSYFSGLTYLHKNTKIDSTYTSFNYTTSNLMCPIKIGFTVNYEVDEDYIFDKGEFDMLSDRIKNNIDSSIISEYGLQHNSILQLSFYWKFNSYKEVSDFLG